jgi:hypothetical protein
MEFWRLHVASGNLRKNERDGRVKLPAARLLFGVFFAIMSMSRLHERSWMILNPRAAPFLQHSHGKGEELVVGGILGSFN